MQEGLLLGAPSVGVVCGNDWFSAILMVRMVNTRSMAAQQDHTNGVHGLEASISDGTRPKTPRDDVFERKIQGLTTDVQLLMEQNREIILELRGQREVLGGGDMERPGSHVPLNQGHDRVLHEEESASTSRF